uniref:Uncharacterized protein n=1 Tax=Ceratitis capitata TaxID=7213 RepID=W8ALB8_CERCA
MFSHLPTAPLPAKETRIILLTMQILINNTNHTYWVTKKIKTFIKIRIPISYNFFCNTICFKYKNTQISTAFNVDNNNATKSITTTTNAINRTTTPVANTVNTYSDMKLFEIIETNSQQQQQSRQQNSLQQIMPAHSMTITPTSSTTSVPINILNASCNQTNAPSTVRAINIDNTTTTFGSVRRSARLQTRPHQLPIVTTVANETPGAIMNADQLVFFDADELHQHVLQQQQQQQH